MKAPDGWYAYSDKLPLAKLKLRPYVLAAYKYLASHGQVFNAPIADIPRCEANGQYSKGLIEIIYPVQMNSTHIKITYAAPMPQEWIWKELGKAEKIAKTEADAKTMASHLETEQLSFD